MNDVALSRAPAAPGNRQVLAVLGLLAVVASGVVGGNAFGTRERLWGSETPVARPTAVSRDAGGAAPADGPTATTVAGGGQQSVLRSQPWWQAVTRIDGSGSMTAPPFTIGAGALQWRVRWSCDTGRLVVRLPDQPRPLVDAPCAVGDTGYGVRTGSVGLQVTADGPWHLTVDQQVDVPLDEPPLPAMSAPGSATVASGSFYRVDQVGSGTVTLYHLADGSYALRLEDFFVTANSDLVVQLSPLDAPKSTDQIIRSTQASVASLDVTTGSLNFVVPPSIDPTQYKSVVLWCEVQRSVYAAAVLKPA
jgi:hypothetical protein